MAAIRLSTAIGAAIIRPNWPQCCAESAPVRCSKDSQLFRCVCRAGKCRGDGVTERLVWHVVKQYAAELGCRAIAPDDLRRSSAKLCHAAEGELEQIQLSTWPRFGPDHGALCRRQTADSRSGQRSDRH